MDLFTISVKKDGGRYLVFNADIWNFGSVAISWSDRNF
jgi:hypothetical protein